MKLSRECRYAIVGLSVLASKPPGTVLGLGALAEEASLPAPFLAKIFHKLARHGILTSFRGRRRGYALARPAGEITMRHVLEAVDGHDLFDRCIFVSESCNSGDPCPHHDAWIPVMNSATSAMSKLTLADIDYTSMQGQLRVRLTTASSRILHITYVEEVDLPSPEHLRSSLARAFPDQPRLTVLPFAMRAVSD